MGRQDEGEVVGGMRVYENCIRQTLGVGQSEARWRLNELVNFLTTASESGEVLQPSEWVDDAWHAVLADPSMYSALLEDCHLPYLWHRQGLTRPGGYERTLELMSQRYGPLSEIAWPAKSAADCGQGCDCGNEG